MHAWRARCDNGLPAGKDGVETKRVIRLRTWLCAGRNKPAAYGPGTERRAAWKAGAARPLSAPSTPVASAFALILLPAIAAREEGAVLGLVVLAGEMFFDFRGGVGALLAAERPAGFCRMADLLLRIRLSQPLLNSRRPIIPRGLYAGRQRLALASLADGGAVCRCAAIAYLLSRRRPIQVLLRLGSGAFEILARVF